MRCLIIHNPASGPSSDEIYAFTHALAQGGDEVVMRFIGDGVEPEDAVADVREFDRVVVSGGDGTVSNVLDQMRGCGVPTLVFPPARPACSLTTSAMPRGGGTRQGLPRRPHGQSGHG